MSRKTLQECLEGYDRQVWGYPESRHLHKTGQEIMLEAEPEGGGKLRRFSFSVREGEGRTTGYCRNVSRF